ncbi:MAG: rod shape-determining protein MreD [Actinomycetota bacterium]|jgi:rod shape-determining protein MreD
MRGWRSLVTAVVLVLCAVIENTWLSVFDLPGAVPPLTLVVVFGFALRRAPFNAALIGFFGGVVIDLMPPSATPLGITAFAFTAVGFGASLLRPYLEGSVIAPLFAAGAAAIASLILRVVVSVAVGVEQNVVVEFLIVLITSPLYSAMLASVVLPLTSALDRMTAPRSTANLFGSR